MAMASTDSIMVGHYEGGHHQPGEYLAASALSDMVTTLLVVPPLAFNQAGSVTGNKHSIDVVFRRRSESARCP